MKKANLLFVFAAFFAFVVSLWVVPKADAAPTFARQTGVACSTCHFQHFPALNAFGRAFKAGGYTQVGGQSLIEGEDLSIPATLNASLITKIRYQMTNGSDASSTTTTNEGKIGKNKGELQFPDEAALLIGGRAGEHIGFLLEAQLKNNTAPAFANFKMPITFDAGGAKFGIIPFTTDGAGVAYGFELLNTGAISMHTTSAREGNNISAQSFIGVQVPAEGFAFIAYNETGFINLSLWAPMQGDVAAGTDFSHYIRVAATPNVAGWDFGIGGQYWGGETKVGDTDNTLSQINVTQAWAVDAQAQGDVGLPLGVYLSYGVAGKPKNDGKTYTFNAYATDQKDKTAWSVLAELGVLPGKVTLAAGYRSGDNGSAANNKDDAVIVGATYLLVQNVQLVLNHASYSGSAYDKTDSTGALRSGPISQAAGDGANSLTTLMLFAAF